MCDILAKRKTLNFLLKICPKMDFGLEMQVTNVGIRINILDIPFVPIFKKKKTIFRTKFVQKWIFGCRSFKNLSLDLESAPPIYHVCQFSVKTLNFWCNCPITCNILVLITFRVLQIAGWSLNDLGGGIFFFFFFFLTTA